ncbi:hypothetical protein BAL199_17888 [alpha proteobacterium BAL199]|nr:hypothetical protein BAL199_17888 [alpha proteobacterium BAL199]
MLARRLIMDGASLEGLREVSAPAVAYNTRHYLALMSAMRDRRMSISSGIQYYERLIALAPPQTRHARRAALQHLLNTDDRVGSETRILVAAMPKSASTYLCSLLAKLTGTPMTTPHNRNDPLGVDFDQLGFIRAYARGGVLHSHLGASDRTLSMVNLLGLKPVVLTRNIFDALASYLEHADHRVRRGLDTQRLSNEQRRRISILMIARHYVEIVASWSMAPANVDVLWVDYDAVSRDLTSVVRRVLEHVGIAVDERRLSDEVAAVDIAGLTPAERLQLRFRQGVSGRGDIFTEDERSWVRTLYAEYPDVDFARIDPDIA